MNSHPFFGVILHDLKMVFNTGVDTFATNGETIFFNPYYLKDLSDFELDVCILHVLIHISLKHHLRYPSSINDQLLHRACDIVTNSNLMYSLDNNMQEIVVQGKTLPHKAPNGVEGYTLNVEDVYSLLEKYAQKTTKKSSGVPSDDDVDYIQPDSFTATNVPIQKKKLFKINSSVSKKLYLKQIAYLDYYPVNQELDWTVDEDTSSFDADKFIYDNIADYPNHIEIHSTIKLSDKMKDELFPIPFYSSDNQQFGKIIDKPQDVAFRSLSFKLNRESLSYFVEHKNKADTEYQKFLGRYLNISDKIRAHFQELDKKLKWSKSGNILFKIRDYIATTFDYDIKYPKAPKGTDPILYFAQVSKKGQCTHFATYMTLMLRYYNIPSRLVGGYLTHTFAGEDVDVYKEDGHAWVEVYINGLGWITIDPTPVIATMNGGDSGQGDSLDSHKEWKDCGSKNRNLKEDELNKKLHEAYKTSKSTSAGTIPKAIEELIEGLSETKIDWRVLINDFVQDEICDYSFSPPDNRFSDSSFLLPSFSERDEKVKKILFMVDVSGSMSDRQIAECFNEINASITQFNGKIEGHIGFFDTDVKTIEQFDQDTDVLAIKPYGRGGTNFHAVFAAVREEMEDDLPVKIIILSDGYADIPREEEAMGIPVLWIINNEEVTPKWGKLVRLI